MTVTKSVSVVVPVYNEEKSLEATVESIKEELNESDWDFEIILVDDASTDGSYEIMKEINGVKVLRHQVNRGYGASLKDGINKAEKEYVMITDADGTYPPNEMPKLLKGINEHGMAVGARTGKEVQIPWIRRPIKYLLNRLTSYLVGYDIPDINSGLRIFKKTQFSQYVHLLPDGFSLTTTITLAYLSDDIMVNFIPINYRDRKGSSKIRPVRDTLNFISLILKTIVYFNPLKVLLPVSVTAILGSVFVGFFSLFVLDQVMEATTIMLFVSGIQILILGLVADLIVTRDKK